MSSLGIKTKFDKRDVCDKDGEIGKAIKHLCDVCEKHGVPIYSVLQAALTRAKQIDVIDRSADLADRAEADE